jgi:hypothetical protein
MLTALCCWLNAICHGVGGADGFDLVIYAVQTPNGSEIQVTDEELKFAIVAKKQDIPHKQLYQNSSLLVCVQVEQNTKNTLQGSADDCIFNIIGENER